MFKMAASEYFHAYNMVEETITRLENLTDPFEIDGVAMRFDYLNRLLVNLDNDTDSNSQTDEIVSLIGDAISINELMQDTQSSFLDLDSVEGDHHSKSRKNNCLSSREKDLQFQSSLQSNHHH